MKVVSNSGPLINLAKVGQFTLLQDLFQQIMVPPEVFEEVVARGVGQPGAGETSTAPWVVRGMLQHSDIANLLTAELDRSEAEAIALALQKKVETVSGNPASQKRQEIVPKGEQLASCSEQQKLPRIAS
jgi:predicted nucleic acid-binding protein